MVHARGGFAIAGQVHHFGIGQHYRVDRRPGIREHRRVVGLFPVMGVPLPFVSAGGSSLILCLGAAGVTISMMKQQPQIQAEMQRV